MRTALDFDDDSDQFERVYQAECECGWLGGTFYAPFHADAEAEHHTLVQHGPEEDEDE